MPNCHIAAINVLDSFPECSDLPCSYRRKYISHDLSPHLQRLSSSKAIHSFCLPETINIVQLAFFLAKFVSAFLHQNRAKHTCVSTCFFPATESRMGRREGPQSPFPESHNCSARIPKKKIDGLARFPVCGPLDQNSG